MIGQRRRGIERGINQLLLVQVDSLGKILADSSYWFVMLGSLLRHVIGESVPQGLSVYVQTFYDGRKWSSFSLAKVAVVPEHQDQEGKAGYTEEP